NSRRRRPSRASAALDRLLTTLGSHALAPPGVREIGVRAWATVSFGAAEPAGNARDESAAVPVRLLGHPWRRTGRDDRRHRRASGRGGRRVGIPVAPSGPLPASLAVGAIRPRRVAAAG